MLNHSPRNLSLSNSPFDHSCLAFYFFHFLTLKEPGLGPHSSADSPPSDPLPSRTSTFPALLNLHQVQSLLSTLSVHPRIMPGKDTTCPWSHHPGWLNFKVSTVNHMLRCLPLGCGCWDSQSKQLTCMEKMVGVALRVWVG